MPKYTCCGLVVYMCLSMFLNLRKIILIVLVHQILFFIIIHLACVTNGNLTRYSVPCRIVLFEEDNIKVVFVSRR